MLADATPELTGWPAPAGEVPPNLFCCSVILPLELPLLASWLVAPAGELPDAIAGFPELPVWPVPADCWPVLAGFTALGLDDRSALVFCGWQDPFVLVHLFPSELVHVVVAPLVLQPTLY